MSWFNFTLFSTVPSWSSCRQHGWALMEFLMIRLRNTTLCVCMWTNVHKRAFYWVDEKRQKIYGRMALGPSTVKDHREKGSSLTERRKRIWGYWAPAVRLLCEELLWDLVSSWVKWRRHPHYTDWRELSDKHAVLYKNKLTKQKALYHLQGGKCQELLY